MMSSFHLALSVIPHLAFWNLLVSYASTILPKILLLICICKGLEDLLALSRISITELWIRKNARESKILYMDHLQLTQIFLGIPFQCSHKCPCAFTERLFSFLVITFWDPSSRDSICAQELLLFPLLLSASVECHSAPSHNCYPYLYILWSCAHCLGD